MGLFLLADGTHVGFDKHISNFFLLGRARAKAQNITWSASQRFASLGTRVVSEFLIQG
jgi:hypothetical protein